jgi:hypothetical protein
MMLEDDKGPMGHNATLSHDEGTPGEWTANTNTAGLSMKGMTLLTPKIMMTPHENVRSLQGSVGENANAKL